MYERQGLCKRRGSRPLYKCIYCILILQLTVIDIHFMTCCYLNLAKFSSKKLKPVLKTRQDGKNESHSSNVRISNLKNAWSNRSHVENTFDTWHNIWKEGFFVATRVADLSHRETRCRGRCHFQGNHKAKFLQPTSRDSRHSMTPTQQHTLQLTFHASD